MKKTISKYSLLIALISAITLLSLTANAAGLPSNISPQQLEQFKKLSPAQQKSLAQSMGIDIRTIQAQMNKSTGTDKNAEQELQQYYPRGTQFDELGNPILSNDLVDIEEDDGTPKPFGYDVFANAPLTFSPSINIAVPSDYVIGSGDTLSITIFGKENAEYELLVSREGSIVLPQLGSFAVAGMSFSEIKAFLAHEIKNKILGVDVVVTLTELRSIRIFVLGDAFKPGPYVLSSLSSITHAIFSAGGINDIGSLRNIQLKRAGKLVTTLDLYDLLIKGDSSNDIKLKSGDVVFISPVGEQATVAGEVKRQAIYELGESETFNDIINMAGGLLASAYPSSTVVERFNNKNLRSLLNIDLSKKEHLNKAVKNGDYIRVMKTSDLFDDSITVIGAVSRPGKYQWQQGQRVADLLPNVDAYVLDNADLTYSLIIRKKDLGRNIEVLQFGLFNALTDLNSVDNALLKPQDKILVFSNVEAPSLNVASLDSFALTQEELIEKEKEQAEKDYEDRIFWLKHGEDSNNFNAFEEKDIAAETLKLATQSLDDLTGESKRKELEARELGVFSRKRLLTPVIQQLTRQAAIGKPIQIVEIAGAVKFPGVYPLAVDAKINNLIAAAGGLLESAFIERAEITRDDVYNNKARKTAFNINLQTALTGNNEDNITLQSKDRLNVHQIPAWQENNIVELRGEFIFPGKYTVRRGETLGQLIERAGGFTDYAYTQASLFTRDKLKQLELQNLIKVSENLRTEIASKSLTQDSNAGVDYKQAKLLLADLTKVEPVGRLVVDIPRVISEKNFDVLLENGDMLFVPAKQNSVNVVGQVQVATSHIFQQGLSVFDYVNLSGGAKKQADDERIYVIKANGAVEIPGQENWFSSTSSDLSPGDTVVVPLDSYYMDNLTLWQTATQIVYQGAVAIAAISGL